MRSKAKAGADITYLIIDTALNELAGLLHDEGMEAWQASRLDGPVVAARDGERVVGAGRLYRSWLHPARWRLALVVNSAERRRGIGSALLDALIERVPSDNRALQAATASTNTVGLDFLEHHGFTPLMATRLGTIDPSAVTPAWRNVAREARERLDRDGFQIARLADRPELLPAAVHAHVRVYRDQHAWNPPIELDRVQSRELFLDPEELDPLRQYLAMHGGEIAGIASLRDAGEPGQLDLGWVGTIDAQPKDSASIVQALVGIAVDDAAQCGATIAVEIDRVDHDINAVIDTLPVEWDDQWLTFSRRV